MTSRVDFTMAADPEGNITLHHPTCPDVRAQASRGDLVCTLIGATGYPPLPRHSCLTERDTPQDP